LGTHSVHSNSFGSYAWFRHPGDSSTYSTTNPIIFGVFCNVPWAIPLFLVGSFKISLYALVKALAIKDRSWGTHTQSEFETHTHAAREKFFPCLSVFFFLLLYSSTFSLFLLQTCLTLTPLPNLLSNTTTKPLIATVLVCFLST
jgi:hypothetical protein